MPAILTAAVPDLRTPVPNGLILISTLESEDDVAETIGPFPVAAFARVSSLIADPVAVNFNNSFPPVS